MTAGLAIAARQSPGTAEKFFRRSLWEMGGSRADLEKLFDKKFPPPLLAQAEALVPEVAERAKQMPGALAAFAFPDATGDEPLHLHKAWHAVHWLVNSVAEGGTEPLSEVVQGGTPIGDDVGGYGPVAFLSAAQVIELDAALRVLPIAARLEQFDPAKAAAAKIYAVGMAEDASRIGEAWRQPARLYAKAAEQNAAVLRWFTWPARRKSGSAHRRSARRHSRPRALERVPRAGTLRGARAPPGGSSLDRCRRAGSSPR